MAGHFWYSDDLKIAVVTMEGLPSLAADRDYQAWSIDNDVPVSLGVLPDVETVAINADLSEADAFAITEEPAGGSEAPSAAPVASAVID
jgi:anti-sigma-K factor RskA